MLSLHMAEAPEQDLAVLAPETNLRLSLPASALAVKIRLELLGQRRQGMSHGKRTLIIIYECLL